MFCLDLQRLAFLFLFLFLAELENIIKIALLEIFLGNKCMNDNVTSSGP